MTITTEGDEAIVEQIVKQLRKLVTTVKVVDLTGVKSVEREMMLLRVDAEGAKRAEVMEDVSFLDDAAQICYKNGYADTDTFTCYEALYQW